MTILTFLLSLYAALLSTFLFGRWMRMVILRRRVREHLTVEMEPGVKQPFIASLPPAFPRDFDEEIEGDVVRGLELEMERLERDEIEESVEEREWFEEERVRRTLQGRKGINATI